jgi:MYXO-CTERM domain-containing protein
LLKAAAPGTTGVFMRLANDNVEGNSNALSFDRAFDGGASNTKEVLDMDLRFNDTGGPADGLGILFLPTGTQGLAGDGLASSEEPNHPGVLGIGYDLYQNAGEAAVPSISVHWNGAIVGTEVPINNPAIALNQFNHMKVVREPVAGGVNVSVILTPDVNGAVGAPVTVIDNLFVAGASNYDYRLQLSARTGGANADHDLDNIVSSQQIKPQTAHTQTNFSTGNGAGWKAYKYGENAAPAIQNDGSSNGEYLRLMHDGNNSQLNSIAFDKQADGIVAGAAGITADFDFRIISPDTPADGFSLLLLPVAEFGDSGAGAGGAVGAEEPNRAGLFGLAFDLYNGGSPFNEVSLHWDGSARGENNIDPSQIDLDSGVFNHARLELTVQGADTLATLILTPDSLGAPGSPVIAFQNLLLPGMSFYDYRAEFVARSGGANMSVDLDNIAVQTVPEPTGAAMALAGLSMLAGIRRRRSA